MSRKYIPTFENYISEKISESFIELDVIDPKSKHLKKLLKDNNVKMEIISKNGPTGHPEIKLTGKRNDLIKVISDEKYGWDDPDLEEYIEESINEMAMTPEEKKARRKARREAKKKGEKLEPLRSKMTDEEKKARRKEIRLAKKNGKAPTKLDKPNSKNKATQLKPEEILELVNKYSPSYKLDWENWGNSYSAYTGERGPRLDHGGGPDGDGWMEDWKVDKLRQGYKKNWNSKMNKMVSDLKKEGIDAEWFLDIGEKGHITLDLEIKK